ncbi:LysR family transcriptional regulator [Lysinibacillus sp. SGAir0095]|uniref:LysR family transcriptional regulator n=1 Tax=Lysinibacillus sp. SGAir0095 TaxID=2070463 RepID=UPI0010CD46E3|nr:LysR family transcriptional regulator [Lysinibacillus sp. SGAir0095]QCR31916.1 LysR family transcriptional regulator [Lysinibacillus sp. SGAir0095]
MEIKQLITFKHAAENLNFTQTAKLLNFAQSSVTAQIKALEEEIGRPLFERLGKRLILTEAGHQFKRYAEKMINLSEEAITAANGEEELTGTLIIGAQESQCTYRLPLILKEFKTAFPKVKLVFKPAHSDEMARKQLMEGELDIAFIMDKKKPEGSLIVEQLIKEELKLVVTSNHPISANAIDDLKHETLLLTETGCSYRNMFEESLNSLGIYPLDKIEFTSIEAIKQCVIAGLGVALLPEMVVKKDIEEGRMKELPWNSFSSPLYTQIAWHKDKIVTQPLDEFISLTRKIFLSV